MLVTAISWCRIFYLTKLFEYLTYFVVSVPDELDIWRHRLPLSDIIIQKSWVYSVTWFNWVCLVKWFAARVICHHTIAETFHCRKCKSGQVGICRIHHWPHWCHCKHRTLNDLCQIRGWPHFQDTIKWKCWGILQFIVCHHSRGVHPTKLQDWPWPTVAKRFRIFSDKKNVVKYKPDDGTWHKTHVMQHH